MQIKGKAGALKLPLYAGSGKEFDHKEFIVRILTLHFYRKIQMKSIFYNSALRFLSDVSMLLNHLADDFAVLVRLFLKSTWYSPNLTV